MSDSTSFEVWRSIPDWEGYYEVSDLGRVKSVARVILKSDGRSLSVKEKFLEFEITKKGYFRVVLSKNHKPTLVKVHRLVLLAFVGPCPDGQEGCHNNGNPADNRLINLRWDTHFNNIRDAINHGTHIGSRERCPLNHLLILPNLVINKLRDGHRACLACRRARGVINSCRKNNRPVPDLYNLANCNYERIMASV